MKPDRALGGVADHLGDPAGAFEKLASLTRQGRAPTHRLDLQAEMLKAHGVVPIYRPLKLQAEREVQVPTSPGQECSSPFRRTHLKAAIELRDVVFPQKPVRLLQTVDALQS